MRSYLEKRHKLFGVVGGIIALCVAVIYLNVIPEEASTASGIQEIILIYGHSCCWLLLSGSSIAWAILKNNRLSAILAYAALATYIIFIFTLLITKFA